MSPVGEVRISALREPFPPWRDEKANGKRRRGEPDEGIGRTEINADAF